MLLRRRYAWKEQKILYNTTLTVGSVTYAIKARRLLLHEGIKAHTVKLTDGKSGGCTHGIVIPSSRFFDAVVILKKNGIDYSLFDGGEKG